VEDLAETKGKLDTALHVAARFGNLPANTTPKNLATTKSLLNGWSALHEAALYGHLPVGTTPLDLAGARSHGGRTALHVAAKSGHLPPKTTAENLLDAKDVTGWTAYDEAMMFGNLPGHAKNMAVPVLVLCGNSTAEPSFVPIAPLVTPMHQRAGFIFVAVLVVVVVAAVSACTFAIVLRYG
jgi:hypothetical protein